jgi:endonuclease VIII
MPEGHTIHRHAAEHKRLFGGDRLRVSSPQGRFAPGAALLDGRVLATALPHGKHLFLGFHDQPGRRADAWLHIHLGLIGEWTFGRLAGPADGASQDGVADDYTHSVAAAATVPPPKGAVRVRLVGERGWADLRGPTVCEVLTTDDVKRVRTRLGADPLRKDADPDRAGARIRKSTVAIGALLMNQEIIAGVGNVYRAEALFRARLDPWAEGRTLDEETWRALWADLAGLLKTGVRQGRIVTTLPEHRDRRSGPARPDDAHYVYRRAGLPCRRCATPVLTEPMVGRNLYRCPHCQQP